MRLGRYEVIQDGETTTLDTGRRLNRMWIVYGVIALLMVTTVPLMARVEGTAGAGLLAMLGIGLGISALVRAGDRANRVAVARVKRAIVIGPPKTTGGYRENAERMITIDGETFSIARVRDVTMRFVPSTRTIYNLYLVLDHRAYRVENSFDLDVVTRLAYGLRQSLGVQTPLPPPTQEPVAIAAAIAVTLPLIFYIGLLVGVTQLVLMPTDDPEPLVRALVAGPTLLILDAIYTFFWGLILRGPVRSQASLMLGVR